MDTPDRFCFTRSTIFCALVLTLLPLSIGGTVASSLPLTTRQQTVRPIALPLGAPSVNPKEVALYGEYGYSAWQPGPGEDQGRRLDLTSAAYPGSPNAARLLTFFSFSDVHITDKESPAQVPYFGWSANFGAAALGLYSQAYSPVMLSSTQVLDAAVRTVNALHSQTPFDFGIMLGDVVNNSQYNELRWFIDVMDGAFITPSSGAHLGADTIGYQKPFQAAGLDRSIPWYQVISNHDQFWMGVIYPTEKLKKAFTADTVLNIGPYLFRDYNSEAAGVYVGVVDGTKPFGDIIKGGPESLYSTVPTVVADSSRRTLTTDDSSIANFIDEFRRSSSLPSGHGFPDSSSACYTFEPKSGLPLKVIVLDNTCKTKGPSGSPAFFGGAWIDAARYAWLTNELQKGQDAGQLMILAAHIPYNPQKDLFNITPTPQSYRDSYKSDAEMIATLQRYPNLLLLIAGHRHVNAITPHVSPDPAHPEYGFWQVETASLRDFPRQFRSCELRRNRDNTLSILATNVDLQTEAGSPAADSLSYAIGAYRIFGNGSLTDESSHAYNAELVKVLTPEMQAKIAALGTPLTQDLRPVIVMQPFDSAANAGAQAGFEVTASSPLGLSYQWQLSTDGGATWGNLDEAAGFSGTRSSALKVLASARTMTGWKFRCVLNDGVNPDVPTRAAAMTVRWSQFSALSARGFAGAGEKSLIFGFVFEGGGKPTMVRSMGPGLLSLGANLTGKVMEDPRLDLLELQGGSWVRTAGNDNWGGGSELRTAFSRLGVGALQDGSKDAALALTLTRSVYTALVSDAGGAGGLVMAEVYDDDMADKTRRLRALSVRSQVGVGEEVLIAGFVIDGDASKKVILRAVGPGLASSVSAYLADPKLQLWKLNSTTGAWSMVAQNDNWGGTGSLNSAFIAASMGPLSADSKDAALYLELHPGIYTAVVTGSHDTSGVALVEIYEAP